MFCFLVAQRNKSLTHFTYFICACFVFWLLNVIIQQAQDVTETKRNDRYVAAMASELRLLIETANAPIFGIDENGLVNEWNQKTAEITGYSKVEAMNNPLVSTFIVPKLQESVQEVMANALKGIERSNYELEFMTKNDEVRYLLVNATTRMDQKNNIIGVVGVVSHDVGHNSIGLDYMFLTAFKIL